MICKPCSEGKHCGAPREKTPSCSCQHRNPGAWKGVKAPEAEE